MSIFRNNLSQKPIASILIMAIILLAVSPILLLPHQAKAQCIVTIAASAPSAQHRVMDSFYQSIDKAYQAGGLTQATLTAAKMIWEKGQQLLEWATGVLLNILLHQLLSIITNDIVNWIQNDETPRFLSEPLGDYLEKAADNAIGAFIDQYLGAGWLCEPFDLDIKLALLEVPTFEEEVRCSLSDIVENINDFYEDFSAGGWKGWIELTKPQNNFYGALLLAQGEKMRVEEEAKKEVESDAQMGEGFLGQKDCRWYDSAGNLIETQEDVRGIPKLPAACKPNAEGKTPGVVRPCHPQCKTKTPATVINEMTKKATTNFYDQMNAQISAATSKAGPYQVYVQAILNALINRVIQEGLLLVAGEPEPTYGATGAATSLPETVSPESVIEGQDNATALAGNLISLKDNENNRVLQEQQTNLAVLELIPSAYSGIIPILDQVITECASTPPYSSYISWAQTQKDNINNEIIPSLNDRISNLETIEIPETIGIINDINTALVSIQDYINKAEAWLVIYEEVSGQEGSLDLQMAEAAMNEAENKVIVDVQQVLSSISQASSTDITGLSQEAFDAIIIVATQATELEIARGDASWPEPSTLYGELEEAQNLENEANSRLTQCLTWTEPGNGGNGGL